MKLNLRSIDLNLLPVFEAIMESGQYNRAAERLAMSQPAMSAAVQRLRLMLDDPLFIRTQQGLVPTERAKQVYAWVHESMGQVRLGLADQTQFEPQNSEASFTIMSGDYFETVILPQILPKLQQQAPGISIHIQAMSPEPCQQLLQGNCDLLLDAFPLDDKRIRTEALLSEKLVVIARQGHPQLNKKTLSEQDFLKLKHAVLPMRGRELPLNKVLAGNKSLQQAIKSRKVMVQVSQYMSLLSVVANSDCIATVPFNLAQRYQQSLQLQVFDFPFKVEPVPAYMMWAQAYDQDPALQWFKKQLLAFNKGDYDIP